MRTPCYLLLLCAGLISACDCGRIAVPNPGEDGGDFDPGPDPEDARWPDAGGNTGSDGGVVPVSCAVPCHGSRANAAPPTDTHDAGSRSLRTVGAHQSHLGRSSWHRDGQCTDCHLVPAAKDDPAHIDPSPAELVWSRLADAGGVTPSWNGTTCTVYCHGPSLAGGRLTHPEWTTFSSAQTYCGDCHGVPPPAPHPQNVEDNCARCHPNAAPGLGFAEPQRHVDGVLDVSMSCDTCHGSNGNPAPPSDTLGGTTTTLRTVGAHRSHLDPSPAWHAVITCDQCHAVPTLWTDPGHLDAAPAELVWGSLAAARAVAPTWNGATCTNYCHGEALLGGSNTTPAWTVVGGSEASCGACHGLPPSPPHVQSGACSTCHGAVIDSALQWVNPLLHVNGVVEATGGCGTCHDLPPQTGTHLLHAGVALPGVYGDLTSAANITTPTSYSFGCGYCHPLDSSRHLSGGFADVELYNANAPAGSLKAASSAASYARGSTTLVDNKGKTYTLGTCSNVYCHSGPTWATPAPVPAPGIDFPWDGGYPINYPAYTVNFARAYQAVPWGGAPLGCAGCHGYPIRTRAPTVQAMAGQSHSWIDASGAESGHAFNHGFAPLSCRVCHAQTVTAANATGRDGGLAVYGPVPITGFGKHVNGAADIAFDSNPVTYASWGSPVSYSLAGASYTAATQTCGNVPCHKAQTTVKSGTPYRWELTAECNACHQF